MGCSVKFPEFLQTLHTRLADPKEGSIRCAAMLNQYFIATQTYVARSTCEVREVFVKSATIKTSIKLNFKRSSSWYNRPHCWRNHIRTVNYERKVFYLENARSCHIKVNVFLRWIYRTKIDMTRVAQAYWMNKYYGTTVDVDELCERYKILINWRKVIHKILSFENFFLYYDKTK